MNKQRIGYAAASLGGAILLMLIAGATAPWLPWAFMVGALLAVFLIVPAFYWTAAAFLTPPRAAIVAAASYLAVGFVLTGVLVLLNSFEPRGAVAYGFLVPIWPAPAALWASCLTGYFCPIS